jgi:hypothetical protein
MLMQPANLFGVLICIITFSQVVEAQCRKPKADDSPHGANEFILFNARTVGRVHGRVFFPNYMIKAGRVRAKNIVVELYSYRGSNSYQDVSQVLSERKRVAACLTGGDGKFSFTGLKPGKYLIRAGTRERDQFNEVYAILILDPKRGIRKGLELILSAGT